MISWGRRWGPLVEPCEWHPEIGVALDFFHTHNWGGLQTLAQRQSVDGAVQLIEALGARTLLDEDIGATPATTVMDSVIGGVIAAWAWRHLPSDRRHDVPAMPAAPFIEELARARRYLARAVAADRDNGVAYGYLVRVAAAQSDLTLLEEAEAGLMRCAHRPLQAVGWLMEARSPKWHGTWEDMRRIAEQFAGGDGMPPARVALDARGHIEEWLYAETFADHRAPDYRGAYHFGDDAVIEHITNLDRKFWHLHNSLPTDRHDPAADRFAHNNLGLALHLAGEREAAGRHVEALGRSPDPWPWTYALGPHPADRWNALREGLGLKPLQRG